MPKPTEGGGLFGLEHRKQKCLLAFYQLRCAGKQTNPCLSRRGNRTGSFGGNPNQSPRTIKFLCYLGLVFQGKIYLLVTSKRTDDVRFRPAFSFIIGFFLFENVFLQFTFQYFSTSNYLKI